jgi:hypothetical protein
MNKFKKSIKKIYLTGIIPEIINLKKTSISVKFYPYKTLLIKRTADTIVTIDKRKNVLYVKNKYGYFYKYASII